MVSGHLHLILNLADSIESACLHMTTMCWPSGFKHEAHKRRGLLSHGCIVRHASIISRKQQGVCQSIVTTNGTVREGITGSQPIALACFAHKILLAVPKWLLTYPAGGSSASKGQ